MTNLKLFSKKDTLIVKGIAVLFLLYHHCFLKGRFEAFSVNFFPLTERQAVLIAAFFKICVGMFVFISGFGMFRSYKKNKEKKSLSLSEYTFDRYYSLWTNWIFVFLLVQLFCWYANRLQIQIYGNDAHSLLYFLSDASGLSFLFDNPLLIATWWYMSLAFLLILVFPICFWLYQKLDVYFFPLIFIFTPFLIELFFPLGRYIGTFVLGMYCADKMIFEKLKSREMFNQSILSKIIKFIILTIFLYYLIKFRQAKGHGSFYFINDGIIPMFVIYYCFEFINDIKYLNSFLEYIGIHSMNIFLIHNFIRVVYFESWTYSFKYWWLIVLVLLIESIILSVAIEKLIKIIKYDKLLISIKKKIKKVLF